MEKSVPGTFGDVAEPGAMQPVLDVDHQKYWPQDSGLLTPHTLWSVDLKLTHLDWSPEATLIHFQAQFPTTCELDYNILQKEIQNVPKTKAPVDVGEFCLVEDPTSACWFRGRVQNQNGDLFDVFLVDYGNVLSVDITHIASGSNKLFSLPPKVVCGFLANVLLQNCAHSAVERYLSSLKGRNVSGFIQALLPHKVLLFEAPDINCELVRHGFGKLMDIDTFLLLVSLLTEIPLKQNTEPVPGLLIEKPKVQRFCLKLPNLQGFLDVFSFFGSKLSCGTHASVRITAAVNPRLFYCQVARKDADLRQMSRKLAMVCECSVNEPSRSAPENFGVLCAVKGKDEKWYRGFVHLLPISSQVRVFFIDYGFFDFVKIDQVQRLPPEFYSTPMRALRCSLPSLTDLDVKAQQLDFLKAGLLGAVLNVEVTSFDKEDHLHTITVLGSDSHVEEPEPTQNLSTPPVLKVEKKSPRTGFTNYMKVMNESCNKMMEEEKVQVGSTFAGYVVHAESPNQFWVRTQKRNEEFEEMMSEMEKHFSEVELDKDTLQNLEVGAVCCALYEKDMHFYRSVVMEVLDHGAEVLFTDFGNVEKVPHMLIKKLPKTLANIPPFAVCCTLNVFPLEEVWASTTCDFFRKAVSDQSLRIHLVQIKKHKCVVELFDMESKSVTELLRSSGLVDYIPVEAVKQKGKNQTKETCQQHSAGRHMSGKSEQWGGCQEDNDVCTTETRKVTHNFKALNIKPGFEFLVYCSKIRSPSDFWCQRRDQGPALEKLMDDLQNHYSAHAVPLQPGEASCVAKSPQDGKWYRGLIEENRNGSATVMLVDYGSVIKVRENHVQAILPEYIHLERQAFRCSLYSPPEQDWSPEVSDLLKDFVLKNTDHLTCQVVSQINVKHKGLWNVVHLSNAQTKASVIDTLPEPGPAKSISITHPFDMTPESFVYSSFDLSSGTEEHVYVSYISSQSELFCHLERNTEIIEELEKKISEESEKMMQDSSSAVVEKLCLAKYLDGKWYRGWMLPVSLPLHISVFFVDYGNINFLEKTKVMFIPRNCEDLLFTPMQAVRCNLYLVPKEELYADVKEWLNNATMNKLLRAVVQAKREDGAFDVELFDGEVSINEKVKELILSLSQKPKPVRLASKSHNKPSYTKTTSKSKNLPTVPAADAPKGSAPKKTKGCMCVKYSNKKSNRKQQNGTHRKMSTSVKPQARSELKQSKYPKERSNKMQPKETKACQQPHFLEKDISPGFRAKCFVSHVDSVCNFFLQLSDDVPGIFKMAEDLSSVVFSQTGQSFQVGDAVLAEFEEDGALYRSVVKKKEGSSCFQVEFVDYGNSAVVGTEKMYLLPEEFMSQPRFSIPCLLLDTKAYEGDASFIDAVLERPLYVDFVRQHGSQWQVKLEVLGEDGHDAAPESSTLSKHECLSLPETNEVISCELKLGGQGFLNEDVADTVSTVEGRSVKPEPKPVNMSVKRKVKTIRRFKQTHSRVKSHRKTKIFSVKVLKEDPDVVLPPAVEPRDTENGTILSIQSDGSFYVRLTKNEDLLTALEKWIIANPNKCETVAEADVKPGLKCLVQILDDVWQRAVVQHTSEGKFKVFLVDHGITKDIPSSSVLQQSPDLTTFPKLALLCRMNSSDFAPQGWGPTLNPLIGTEVQLMFVSYTEPGNFWVVEVVMKDRSLILQSEASHQQNKDPPTETQSEASAEGTAAPQHLLFAPVETDKAYSGFATAVSTPFHFCVVLEDLLLVMNQISTMLASLPSQMPSLPKTHLVPGTCCLLESESKKMRCRAEIIHADTTIVLNLVDYGHYECIPYHDHSKLKKLNADLTSQPKVIYPCVLQGVMPVSGDGQWTDEAAVFFQDCLCQKNLQIFFRESVSSEWRVDILADDVDVADELVEAGHAAYTEVMLGLRFERGLCKPEGSDSKGEEDEAELGENRDSAKSRSSQCLLM
nr:tudor domain-containing protein 15 isoform X2 [Nothobranchius furzeri]